MSRFWFFVLCKIFKILKPEYKPSKILILGHRGNTNKFLENTLESLENAINIGADGVEFDIQVTKDKEFVVFHDEKLDRLTGLNGHINEYDLMDLQKKATFIKTLKEILEKLPANKTLNVELKDTFLMDKEKNIEKILELLLCYEKKYQFILSSFSVEIIEKLLENKKFKIGLLLPYKLDFIYLLKILKILSKLDFLNPHIDLLSKNIKNAPLIVWGHKENLKDIEKFKGFYGLITDGLCA